MLLAACGKRDRALVSVNYQPFLLPMLLLKMRKYKQSAQPCGKQNKVKVKGSSKYQVLTSTCQDLLINLANTTESLKKGIVLHSLQLWKRVNCLRFRVNDFCSFPQDKDIKIQFHYTAVIKSTH